jgi:kynureninase
VSPEPIAGADPLLAWRPQFPILDTCTYLVSHSLGAMPNSTADELALFAATWAARGVQAWHEGWWEMGQETANLLAPIIGVPTGTLTMHQNVTVAQSVIASCFEFSTSRNRIVLQDLDFPSNHYLFEGFRRYGAEIVYVTSADSVRAPIDRLVDAIDDRTVLVPLSYVLFRSACIQDVRPVIEKAHKVGARVILDLYQAAGTVPPTAKSAPRPAAGASIHPRATTSAAVRSSSMFPMRSGRPAR